jgi:hypothetical protein
VTSSVAYAKTTIFVPAVFAHASTDAPPRPSLSVLTRIDEPPVLSHAQPLPARLAVYLYGNAPSQRPLDSHRWITSPAPL